MCSGTGRQKRILSAVLGVSVRFLLLRGALMKSDFLWKPQFLYMFYQASSSENIVYDHLLGVIHLTS